MTDRTAALAEALASKEVAAWLRLIVNSTHGQMAEHERLGISVYLAAAILAALPPDWCGLPGFVPVRLYSGGVLADGTTNTEPIDFLNPPPETRPITDPTAALAEALEQADAMLRRPVDGTTRKRHRMGAYYRRDCAALVVALLPPDWCGHAEEIERLYDQIARQASAAWHARRRV